MLAKFAVKNYRGFRNRVEWDMSHPSNYSFHTEAIKEGIVKNGIIYGPNGAGKSNFGLAIFDIANHLSHKWKKPDYYLNYACAESHQKPVEFEYDFVFDGCPLLYRYSKVAKDLKGEIVDEELTLDGNVLISKRDGIWYSLPSKATSKYSLSCSG